MVWGYAIAWFLVNDQAKLLTYRLLDHIRAEAPNAAGRASAKTAPQPSGATLADGHLAAVLTDPASAGRVAAQTADEREPSQAVANTPSSKATVLALPARDAAE
jgi:hypothetical protein